MVAFVTTSAGTNCKTLGLFFVLLFQRIYFPPPTPFQLKLVAYRKIMRTIFPYASLVKHICMRTYEAMDWFRRKKNPVMLAQEVESTDF